MFQKPRRSSERNFMGSTFIPDSFSVWPDWVREGQRAGCRWEVLTVHVPLVFILDEGIAPGLS